MKTSLYINQLTPDKRHETAVVLHLYYTELFDEVKSYLDNLSGAFDLYISLPEDQAAFESRIREEYPDATILLVPNRGRDLAPFIELLKIIIPLDYKTLLKVHTKKTLHREDGTTWRKDVFGKLLGSEGQVASIFKAFAFDKTLAMIGPQDHVLDAHFYMGKNSTTVQNLLYQCGYAQSLPESFFFVASTMFWAKPGIFKPLLKAKLSFEDFEMEPLPVDGSLAHAVERFIGLLVEVQGKKIRSMDAEGKVGLPDPFEIYPFATPPAHLRLRNLKSVVFYRNYEEAYAIEYLRVTAPFRAAGLQVIDGGNDPELACQADAIIFQREFPKNLLLYDQVIAKARAGGKFVLYELDDLLFDLPEGHPERTQELYNAALVPMMTAIIDADLVLVPTEEMRKVVESFNPNVIVLPNYLDDTIWQIKEPIQKESDEPLVLGYMGGNSHTPDLEIIEHVLWDLLSKYKGKITLEVWGTPLPDGLKGLEGVLWHPSPTNVYTDFVEFFQSLKFDLVIAPLADNLFNRCKSSLKFLEYSANGTPGVYSQIAPYEGIVEDGINGFLASNRREWFDKLSLLIEKPELRQQMAIIAQNTVREKWLLSQNIHSWHDIFGKLNRNIFLEDPRKPIRAHIANIVNRQLFSDRENAAARFQNLELEASQNIQSLTQQLHQKDEDFHAFSVKREEEFSEKYQQLEQQIQSLTQQLHQKDQDFHAFSVKREEEFSEKYQQLEQQIQSLTQQLHQKDEEYQMVVTSMEESGDRIRQLINTNEDLNSQLHYWFSQATFRQNEIQTLAASLQDRDRSLNEIYSSKAWKMLSRNREERLKFSGVTRKLRSIAGPIKSVIPGRISNQKTLLEESGLFNSEYYLRLNPDVRNAGVDPILHYLRFGGAEGRDPSSEFDSSWYLDTYPDIKSAGINPLLHYLTFGKKEGRQIRSVRESSTLTDNPHPFHKIRAGVTVQVPEQVMLAPQMASLLTETLHSTYIVSLSHDDYLTITGGAQVYIADEQRLANQAGLSYLHIYPFRKNNSLVSDDELLYLGINVDGIPIACTEAEELIDALNRLEGKVLDKVSIHHSMGFSAKFLQDVLHLSKNQGVFWLHDYFSLCPSYNLLRNDVEYCDAPDINSNACRLCRYGNARADQAAAFERLFKMNKLEVASPSHFTYELWQSHFPVVVPVRVIPPVTLKWKSNSPVRYKGGTLRVGFLGYPLDYKGWPTWLRLVNRFTGNNYYKFFHFSTQQGEQGNYSRIEIRVTTENRMAMVESLRWNQIDVVVLWSNVAETFSFTLHEALAAGCYILTNPKSGNIQDYIRHNPERGMVLEDEEALIDLFESGRIVEKVEQYQKNGKPQADLVFGTLEEIKV